MTFGAYRVNHDIVLLQLLNSSAPTEVKCNCGELSKDVSSYATGFSMPKVNTIDFKYIFAHLLENIMTNPTVYCTVLAIIVVYVLLIVWARRMDRRDLDRVSTCSHSPFVERHGSGVELRTHDRLRESGFESYVAVLIPWGSFFTLHCSSSLSCINEYLAIDSGGYVYEQPFTLIVACGWIQDTRYKKLYLTSVT